MTATVDVGRDDIACPRHTVRQRDGSRHEFNVTYVGGLLQVSHNAAGTCVGECEWTFVLMLECCITSTTAISGAISGASTNTSANLRTGGAAEPSAASAAILAPADVEATTTDPDDGGGPSTGLIVGIVVAVVVLVLLLATCTQVPSSLLSQAKPHVARPLYAPRTAPVDVVYTRIGSTPLLNMRVPVRR
jgi:hypothetical protein